MRKLLISGAGMAMLFLSGCMSAPGGIAPSTIPITSKDSYTVIRREAEGSDFGVRLVGFPIGPLASAYKALQSAKEKNNADALINVTAENRYKFFLIVVCIEEMVVTGDAIKFKIAGEDVE
ncbi:MAG: hypothetical protein A2017_15325 [Lentisphaerae bacterium GWF2_44_16]|nr:MAG: hypothetical protein A2017_15325 [Lentisphaerae bacterium GWF2_44_16]